MGTKATVAQLDAPMNTRVNKMVENIRYHVQSEILTWTKTKKAS